MFEEGALVYQAPPLPLIVDQPDYSQIKKFTESDSFYQTVAQYFNKSMEAQKWVKNREVEDNIFGYKNLQLDPDITDMEFIKTPKDDLAKSYPKTSGTKLTSKQTYADITVDKNNFIERVTQALASLAKVDETLQYLNNSTSELDSRWSAHNAYMITTIGPFAHEQELLANLSSYESTLQGIVNDINDNDKKQQYQEKLTAFTRTVGNIKSGITKAKNNKLNLQFENKEVVTIASLAIMNISSISRNNAQKQEAAAEQDKEKQKAIQRKQETLRSIAREGAKRRALVKRAEGSTVKKSQAKAKKD